MIHQTLTIWPLVPLPFLNPAWTLGSSWLTYCWSMAWRILSITLLACEMSAIVCCLSILWHCLLLGLEWKLTFCTGWVFYISWHIKCSTFTASSFRIWNSSTGILSPSLALSIVMLPMAHLTSHSMMSGFRWVITPSWLSGSWSSVLYSPSVYSCHLFLISSASVRYLPFLSFMWRVANWKKNSNEILFHDYSFFLSILKCNSINYLSLPQNSPA